MAKNYYYLKDGKIKKASGWLEDVHQWLGISDSSTLQNIFSGPASAEDLSMYQYLSSLPEEVLATLLDPYFTDRSTLAGTSAYALDTKRLRSDYSDWLKALEERPEDVDANALWDAAVDDVTLEDQALLELYSDERAAANALWQSANTLYDDTVSRLDSNLARRTALYEDDLSGIRSQYGNARTGMLSQQYQQNAQLMDSLQSQMSKAQRNALEAGASAGLRIAGNINTLLSVQNKQAQQSVETSNQLAQMLINQRAAERGARNDYDAYMQNDATNRTQAQSNLVQAQANRDAALSGINTREENLKLSQFDRTSNRYNSAYDRAQSSYDKDMLDWRNKYYRNPFFATSAYANND